MKFLLIICSLVIVAVAQDPSLSCNYFIRGGEYFCDLTLNNPSGFDDFNAVGGIHLEGYTNADVDIINRASGTSTNIPRIICDTFPNVYSIDIWSSGVTTIHETSFVGCTNLTELHFYGNRISVISENAFANHPGIVHINLGSNLLTTLPENVFANQQNLRTLEMNYNSFTNLPAGIFDRLVNLEALFIGYANLQTIGQLFTNNGNLNRLYLSGNRINTLADNSFVGMDQLRILDLASNEMFEIPVQALSQLPNLEILNLGSNRFAELRSDEFMGLEQLISLDLGSNFFNVIPHGAFRGLVNLDTLTLAFCGIRQLNTNSFEGLDSVTLINLNFNEVEELPADVFAPTESVLYIALWANRLKTLRRNSFGNLTALETIDLDGNVVNAIDREIIEDAVNLNTLFFIENLCASSWFLNVRLTRPQLLFQLETCFANMRFIVDIITAGNAPYHYFDAPQPGINLRVIANNEIHIALTPYSFTWSPIIEILIGTSDNTLSVIRRNQETDVVTIPTPDIIEQGQWNDFRVTWANHFVLVYRSNDTFPFFGYNMQDIYPVNFYGLRAIGSSATWTVQPV